MPNGIPYVSLTLPALPNQLETVTDVAWSRVREHIPLGSLDKAHFSQCRAAQESREAGRKTLRTGNEYERSLAELDKGGPAT